jgi:spore maturation protein CgeB
MRSRVRIVTNFRSPTATALAAAAVTLGHEMRCLDEFPSKEALAAYAPTAALVFMYGFPEAALAAIRSLKSLGIRVAVWQIDDPHYFRAPELHGITAEIARACDVYYTHTHELDDEYRRLGAPARVLPIGARVVPSCAKWTGSLPEDSELTHDVTFCGSLTDRRKRMLATLRDLLPPRVQLDVVSGVPFETTFEVYRRSRISLSLGASYEHVYPTQWAVTERTWEVPLVGGFLLQPDRRDLHEYFEVGSDAETFGDLEDCACKVVHYLAHSAKRREIARRAQRTVVERHLFTHRLEVVVRDLSTIVAGSRASLEVVRGEES